MMAAIILAVALSLAGQTVAVSAGPFAWAQDVLQFRWKDSTGATVEPPDTIKQYVVNCGRESGKYTRKRTYQASRLVVQFREVLPKPSEPTEWFCEVQAMYDKGIVGPKSAEVAFVIE